MRIIIKTLFGSALLLGAFFAYWVAISFYAEMPRHAGVGVFDNSAGGGRPATSNTSNETSAPLSPPDGTATQQSISAPAASSTYTDSPIADLARKFVRGADLIVPNLNHAESGNSFSNADLSDAELTDAVSWSADPGTAILNPYPEIPKIGELSGNYLVYAGQRAAADLNSGGIQAAHDGDQGFFGADQTLASFDTASLRAVAAFPGPAVQATPFQVPGFQLPPFEPPAVQVAPQVPTFQVPAVPACCTAP